MVVVNRTGSQAQLSGRSWSTSRTARKTAAQKKNVRGRKVIKHPRFLECLPYIDDPQWKIIFEDAAYGKFPNRFSMRNERLIYKKPKIITLDLPLDTQEMISEVKEFMRKNGNIHTTRDIEDLRRGLARNNTHLEEFTWSKLDKGLRNILIYKFAAKNKEKYNLNQTEYQQCICMIKYGIYMKFFTKKHIQIEKRQITHIEGFCFDPKSRKFYIHPDYEILPKTKSTKERKSQTENNLLIKHYQKNMDRIVELRQGKPKRTPTKTDLTQTEKSTSDITETTHSQSINFHRISRHLNSATASESER